MTSGVVGSAHYLYSNEGNRVLTNSANAGTTTDTIYFDGYTETVLSGGTTTTTKYYSANGTRLAVRVGSSTLDYFVGDPLGSNTIALNNTGQVIALQHYSPYGTVDYSWGTMPTSYNYAGERLDSQTGLLYDNFRYYDAFTGRFVRSDNVTEGFERYFSPIRDCVQARYSRRCTSRLKEGIKVMFSPQLQMLVAQLQELSPMPDDDTLYRLPEENHPLERLDALLAELEVITKSDFPLELISVLLDVYGIDDGYGVFQRMSGLIESYPHLEEAYMMIRQGTENPHPGTRKWCCDLLSKRREKEDEPFFVARFQDEDAAVRTEAINGILRLSQCHPMTHLIPLIKSCIGDQDNKVASMAYCVWQSLQESLPEHQREDLSFEELPVLDRMAAIETQAFADKEFAREILLSYAQDRFWEVRKMIARELERWKDVQVVGTLQKLSQDRNKEVRIEAIRSLHVVGVKSTIDPLIACLQDTEWDVRKRAVLALKRWDDPKIVKVLQSCVHDPDERVRFTVMEALREIEAKQAGQ